MKGTFKGVGTFSLAVGGGDEHGGAQVTLRVLCLRE